MREGAVAAGRGSHRADGRERYGPRARGRLALLSGLIAACLPSFGVQAAPMLDISSSPVDVGDAFEVSLLDTVAAVEAADIAIRFDPAVIVFQEAVAGSLTGSFLFFADEASPGEVNVSLIGGVPATGSGSLLTVLFQASSPGTSPIEFSDRFPNEPDLYHFEPVSEQVVVQVPEVLSDVSGWGIFGLGLTALLVISRCSASRMMWPVGRVEAH